MKILILALMLVSAFSVTAHDKGNGGGQYEVLAVDFPDQSLLVNAVKLIKEKTLKSRINQAFGKRIIAEAEVLLKTNSYRYIDRDITDVNGEKITAYKAWTTNMRASLIFFTKETLYLPQDKFSALMLHEILHHLLPLALSDDEELVNGITDEIIFQTSCDNCHKALEDGIYIRKNKILATQVIEAWDFAIKNQGWCINEVETDELLHSICENNMKELVFSFYTKIAFTNENVWNESIDMVEADIIKTIRVSSFQLGLHNVGPIQTGEIRNVLVKLAKKRGYKPAANAFTFKDLFR